MTTKDPFADPEHPIDYKLRGKDVKPLKPKPVKKVVPKQSLESKVEHGLVVATGNDIYCVEPGKKWFLAERKRRISCFGFHDGKLYDTGWYHAVFDTLRNERVVERTEAVYSLVSHGGKLYGGGAEGVFDTLNDEPVAEREDAVLALVSHGGKLYDGSFSGTVFDTLNDPKGKKPLWTFDNEIECMISIPIDSWESLAKKGKVVK